MNSYRPFSNAVTSSYSRAKSSSFSAKDFKPQVTPDPEGPLFGKKIVFTGALECMPRREAFQAVVDAGAVPVSTVSKQTHYLVVGTNDLHRVGKSGLSYKIQKAQALTSAGGEIQVIDEDQFVCLLLGTRY